MKFINLIEINNDGDAKLTGLYQVQFIPRIKERIKLVDENNDSHVYQVVDVEYSVGEEDGEINIYVSCLDEAENIADKSVRIVV